MLTNSGVRLLLFPHFEKQKWFLSRLNLGKYGLLDLDVLLY